MKIGKILNYYIFSKLDNPIYFIGAFARIFSLEHRRNLVACWMDYEKIKHLLPDIDSEIADEMGH